MTVPGDDPSRSRRPILMHVISGLTTGGAEGALARLMERGLGAAFENHVVSLADEGTFAERLRDSGARVHALGMKESALGAIARLRVVARAVRPDLTQGWMYHGNLGALAAAGWLGPRPVPTVWSVRQGLDSLRAEKPSTRGAIILNRLLSNRPAAILYNSRRAREQHETYGFRPRRGRFIPNGFELDRYAPNPVTRAAVRDDLGIPRDAFLIGQIARLHWMKNQQGLLEAAARMFDAGVDAHFLIVGRDVTPASINLDTIIPSRFRDRFHIYGDRADAPALMQGMDLYVSPSLSEAFPNVVGEAMASGLPTIGTDVGETRLLLQDAGVIVPPGDAAALAAAMIRLVGDSSTRHALGQGARRLVGERFGIGATVDHYIGLYDGILRRTRRH